MNTIHCKRIRGDLIVENKIIAKYVWRSIIVHCILEFLRRHKYKKVKS